jgi:hypothetical protein
MHNVLAATRPVSIAHGDVFYLKLVPVCTLLKKIRKMYRVYIAKKN